VDAGVDCLNSSQAGINDSQETWEGKHDGHLVIKILSKVEPEEFNLTALK